MDGSTVPSAVTAGHPDIVVIGGSLGSLQPLRQILAGLPADLEAAVFVVQHRAVGAQSVVPILATSGALKVVDAEDQTRIHSGQVYVAPADRHLLFLDDVLRLVHGPRENLARPSIDVLFRSAAVTYRSRVIGVILSGALDDGEHGLLAIQRCGGHTIVQDPEEAAGGDLPRAALRSSPHECLPAAQIAASVSRLVRGPARPQPKIPEDLLLEARAASLAMVQIGEATRAGEPTLFTCPECQGPLWQMPTGSHEFRCNVGHAFSLESLNRGQAVALERALWVAYRVVNERARLLQRMAETATERGMVGAAASYSEKNHELRSHSQAILEVLAGLERPIDASRSPEG